MLHVLIAHIGHPQLNEDAMFEVTVLTRLTRELSDVADASREEINDIRKALNAMREDMKFVETEEEQAKRLYENVDDGESPVPVLAETRSKVDARFQEIEAQSAKFDESIDDLITLLAEKAGPGPARDKKIEELLGSMHQFMTMFRQAWEEITKDTKRFHMLKEMDVPPARTIIDSKMFEPDGKDKEDANPKPMAPVKKDDGPEALVDVSLDDEVEGDASGASPAPAKKKK